MSDAPTSGSIAPRSVPMSTIATISGSPVATKSARASVRRAVELAAPEQRRGATDHEQQREEERREREAGRRQQAVDVEVDPGDDEVDRDEEAEADALEAHADDLAVGRVEDEPHDEPRGERAQDEVEAHVAREEHERARG